MLKLDLKETEIGAALVLAAVVAGQVAENLSVCACIQGLGPDSVGVTLYGAGEHLRGVFVTHLGRQLGVGFLVESDDDGLVTVRIDEAEEEVGAEEEGETAVEPKSKPRRGRPPGKKPANPPTE